MTHRTAAERRKARQHERTRKHQAFGERDSDDWLAVTCGPPAGPDVRVAGLEEVLGSLGGLSADLPWADVAPLVVPLFERVRPFLPAPSERVTSVVPPGIPITLGIDLGPAFAHVTASMVETWPVSSADVTAQALANLHGRASAVEPARVVWDDIDGVPTGWLQTDLGIGSTLVLAPDELRRILGGERRLLVAPMRDLLVAVPPDEVDLATWLYREVASQDPNHLHPRLFGFDGRAVSVRAMA